MATRTISNAGGNFNATAAWAEGVVPTGADDIVATASSGALAINVNSSCRSINLTNYASILTHSAAVTLSVGDSVAGTGNIALKFPSTGMTYTLGNISTSAITFVSTSATLQTIDYGGKNCGAQTFAGTGGSWQFVSAVTTAQNSSTSIILTRGSLDTNGQTITTGLFQSTNSNTRSLTLGASTLNLSSNGSSAWATTTITNLTFNAGTSTINHTNANGTFSGGGLTYYIVNINALGGGSTTLLGANTYDTLNIKSAVSGRLTLGADQATTNLSLTSTSGTNRGIIQSTVPGTARTITATTLTAGTDINLQDVVAAGASAPWTLTGASGDVGGNTNIIFPAPVTRYWVATAGGSWESTANWSASSGGTSGASIPLSQDTAVFDANSITSAGRTITINAQVLPALDFSNVLNSPTIAMSITNGLIYLKGNLTLRSGLTFSGTTSLRLAGRGVQTITSAGVTISNSIQIDAPGGSYTLQDALTLSNTLNLNIGTVDANNFNVTCTTFSSSNTNTRTINMGSGTWTVTGAGVTVWSTSTTTGLTLNPGSSTLLIADISASVKNIDRGVNHSLNNVTVAGGTGIVSFRNALTSTINNLAVSTPPANIRFNSPATYIFTGSFPSGTAGNLVTIDTNNIGTSATLSKSSGTVSSDYLSIKDSNAAGGASWFAGANSTDVSNNTGWIFQAAPVESQAKFFAFFK